MKSCLKSQQVCSSVGFYHLCSDGKDTLTLYTLYLCVCLRVFLLLCVCLCVSWGQVSTEVKRGH